MSFEREQDLEREIRDLDRRRSHAVHELSEQQADDEWRRGNKGTAMVILHNSGWDSDEMVTFARARGLSRDEARQVIREAPIDYDR